MISSSTTPITPRRHMGGPSLSRQPLEAACCIDARTTPTVEERGGLDRPAELPYAGPVVRPGQSSTCAVAAGAFNRMM
jgi:hypothetical protein